MLALAVCAGASASAAASPGRVVRVERQGRRLGGVPRMCIITPGTPASAICLGPSPKLGDEIHIVGKTRLVGAGHITQLRSVTACGEDPSLAWAATLELEGDVDADLVRDEVIGVLDVATDPHTHLVEALPTPGSSTSAIPNRAIDTDGDGVLDLEFTVGPCDDVQRHKMCFGVWTSQDGHSLQQLRRDATEGGGC
jgi:hypothetical protein